jgi:ADP-ribose pyrophosphatase
VSETPYPELSPERVVSSRRIYEGSKAALRVDKVELTDGRTSEREILEHPDVAAIVPLDDDGCVVMVAQYRLATGGFTLEIPAGVIDPGESIEQCAQRELAEETGLRAGMLEKLVQFYVSPGISTEVIHLFLAEDLSPADASPDDDEDLAVRKVPLSTAVLMAERGEFADAKTVAGVLLAARARRLLH